MIKVGTDFSGIGAPEQALKELGIPHSVEFACDKDKYARQTYMANHSAKIMYDDVTTRDNNEAPYVDLYCFGFPCQAFSLSGKRKGFDDVRGTLFFNSADYIKKHRPAVFLAENVKGLLSHDKPKGSKSKHGRTFSTIINLLAKTINGQILMPMYEDNLGYNVYYTVLNSKHYDVPQNRERVFILGFRDDITFNFPTSKTVTKKLADILEKNVDDKYYLSDRVLKYFETRIANYNGGKMNYKDDKDISTTICASATISPSHNLIVDKVETFKPSFKTGDDLAKTVKSNYHKTPGDADYIKEGIETIGEVTPNSQAGKVYGVYGVAPTISAGTHGYALGYIQEPGCESQKLFPYGSSQDQKINPKDGVSQTLSSGHYNQPKIETNTKIRRLTPLECMRLQGFPDTFIKPCSDTQIYKQAGNSITVPVLKAILKNISKAMADQWGGTQIR